MHELNASIHAGTLSDCHKPTLTSDVSIAGLPNGHISKKRKKSKKDDALPSLDGMLSNDDSLAFGSQRGGDDDLCIASAATQEAALQLLESLLEVRKELERSPA